MIIYSKIGQIATIIVLTLAAAAYRQSEARAQLSESDTALPSVTATLSGPAVTMYSWIRSQCEPADFPDSEARAFRDAGGVTHLFVVGHEGYAAVGPNLEHLRHDCHVVLHSANRKDPARFADASWLASFYTADGRTVYALVHNEFHGWQHASTKLCPSHDPRKCSYVSFTSAISVNRGQTFAVEPPPRGVVVASPYRYHPDFGFAGYMNPSNIIKFEGYYYVVFGAVPFKEQQGGICLMRTATLSDPSSWRAWNGHGFTIAFADPYVMVGIDAARSVCKPLGPAVRNIQGVSLVRHLPDGLFIMIGQGDAPELHATGTPPYLVPVVATSRNLIDWSPTVPLLSQHDEERLGSARYPTLLDPASTDRNFSTIGDKPALVYVHLNNPYGNIADRDVLRVPLNLHLIVTGAPTK